MKEDLQYLCKSTRCGKGIGKDTVKTPIHTITERVLTIVIRLPGEVGDPLLVSYHGRAQLFTRRRLPTQDHSILASGDESARVRRPSNTQHPILVA